MSNGTRPPTSSRTEQDVEGCRTGRLAQKSPKPRFRSARRLEDPNARKREICEFLENLKVIFDTSTIPTREFDPGSFKAYGYSLSFFGLWGPEVEILSIQEDIAGNSKEKTSLWDSSFDISAHNKACYLMEDNVALLNLLDARRICGDAEGLLSQVTTLVCLANAKLKEGEKVEKKRIEQVKGLQKRMLACTKRSTNSESTRSMGQITNKLGKTGGRHEGKFGSKVVRSPESVGRPKEKRAASDRAAILHPSMDLSEVNPCKIVVDGKIVDSL
ncbi:hypothetical protein ACSQ67_014688 [Phaseolus vulgaris]